MIWLLITSIWLIWLVVLSVLIFLSAEVGYEGYLSTRYDITDFLLQMAHIIVGIALFAVAIWLTSIVLKGEAM